MRALGASRTSVATGGVLAGNWARDPLWKNARAVPSLDLNFAGTKTLDSRVTFTRASSGTYVGSDGLIKTATTNEARFDHNPTTGESLGLLVEEARTNSIRNNTGVGAVAGTPGTLPTNWSTATSAIGTSSEVVGVGTEDGINYVDIKWSGTVSSSGSMQNNVEINAAIAAASGQSWTSSAYLRLVNGSLPGTLSLLVIERSAAGSFLTNSSLSATVTSSPLKDQRYSLSRLFNNALTAFASMRVDIGATSGVVVNFTLRIGLPQLELGAFATSVIPTTSATVTRAADVASITGTNFSSWYNHDEGTLRATASIRGGNTVVSSGLAIVNGIAKLAETAATTTSRVLLFNTSTSPNRYTTGQRSAVANITVNDNTYEAIQLGKYYNLTTSYVNNSTQGLALSVDGRTVLTNATAVDVPVPTRLLIGAGNSGSNVGVGVDEYYLNGTIKRLTFWPTRLSNTVLQQITQP